PRLYARSNIIPNSVRAAFQGEQFLLPVLPPAVAREVAVRPDRAVAGNQDGDRVRGAGAADGPGRAGTSDPPRDLPVAARGAGRNRPELFPDPGLEGGGAGVQRERPLPRFAL